MGQVKSTQRTPFGVFSTNAPCQNCHGTGKIIKEPCQTCKGEGKTRKTRTIQVKIPAGIDDGQTISLRGEGNGGSNGGPAGDLYVTVYVKEHKMFKRDGQDIILEMPISFAQAALGAQIEIPTLDGKVTYDIPEGTQTGTTFRLRDKGIPYVNNRTRRGDQLVTVVVETPTRLTREQKELLRQLDETMTETPKRKKFFDTIKDLFD
jgi:molecular chaperone DnaJ